MTKLNRIQKSAKKKIKFTKHAGQSELVPYLDRVKAMTEAQMEEVLRQNRDGLSPVCWACLIRTVLEIEFGCESEEADEIVRRYNVAWSLLDQETVPSSQSAVKAG